MGVVTTLGIDLASGQKKTACCLIKWFPTGAATQVFPHCGDDKLLEKIGDANKVGVDIPFGWPEAFVAAVSSYHALHPWPHSDKDRLRLRETDRFVWNRIRHQPLSVSTSFIAIPAMKAACLFAKLAEVDGRSIDRTGAGKLVEVYPRAALNIWGMRDNGYKKAEQRAERSQILESLEGVAGKRLEITSEDRNLILENDDALDALICSLVARAQHGGLCESIPDSLHSTASREGWIALPRKDSLKALFAT